MSDIGPSWSSCYQISQECFLGGPLSNSFPVERYRHSMAFSLYLWTGLKLQSAVRMWHAHCHLWDMLLNVSKVDFSLYKPGFFSILYIDYTDSREKARSTWSFNMKTIINGDSHTRSLKAWKVFSRGGHRVQICHLDADWEDFHVSCQEADRVVLVIGSNNIEPWLGVSPSPRHAAQTILRQLC